ncbi:hypothetical protein AB3S75_047769 [Citrus x aurantiifolia]
MASKSCLAATPPCCMLLLPSSESLAELGSTYKPCVTRRHARELMQLIDTSPGGSKPTDRPRNYNYGVPDSGT